MHVLFSSWCAHSLHCKAGTAGMAALFDTIYVWWLNTVAQQAVCWFVMDLVGALLNVAVLLRLRYR